MNWQSGWSSSWNVLCGFAIDPVLYKELQSSSLDGNQGNGTVSLLPFEHRSEKSKKKKNSYQAKQSITLIDTHTLYHSKYFSKNTIHLQKLYINNKRKSQQLVCSSLACLESTGAPQGNQSAEHQVPLGSENKIKLYLNLSEQSFRDNQPHYSYGSGRKVRKHRIWKLLIWV